VGDQRELFILISPYPFSVKELWDLTPTLPGSRTAVCPDNFGYLLVGIIKAIYLLICESKQHLREPAQESAQKDNVRLRERLDQDPAYAARRMVAIGRCRQSIVPLVSASIVMAFKLLGAAIAPGHVDQFPVDLRRRQRPPATA
jgi:hypothetical protein